MHLILEGRCVIHIDLLNVKVRLVTVSFFFMSFRKLSYKCVLGFLCLVFF